MSEWKRGDRGWAIYRGTNLSNKVVIRKMTARYNGYGCDGQGCTYRLKTGELAGVDGRQGHYCLSCCRREKPEQPK